MKYAAKTAVFAVLTIFLTTLSATIPRTLAGSYSPGLTAQIELASSISTSDTAYDSWQPTLYAPTQLQYIEDKWLLVDCWHNRILWSRDLSVPIEKWGVVDDNLAGPHSITYSGKYYAVEDTGRHGVKFYVFQNDAFQQVGELYGLGERTHRIRYHEENDSYYVLSSDSQQMYRIMFINGVPTIIHTEDLTFLNGSYTRSFSFVDDTILFVSGTGHVVQSTFLKDSYIEVARYKVPKDFISMNDIYYDNGKYIVTATPHALGVIENLSQLNVMENVVDDFGITGTPYYVTKVDSYYIVPEIDSTNQINIISSELTLSRSAMRTLIHGKPSPESKQEKSRLPK